MWDLPGGDHQLECHNHPRKELSILVLEACEMGNLLGLKISWKTPYSTEKNKKLEELK